MGLDASVMCNCFQQGKARPCPFPDDFYIDADGFPAVRLEGLNEDADYEKSEQFDIWLADCCDHPYMDYTTLYIADSNGYHSFMDALEQIGWEHFPTLKAELPESNHGSSTAAASAKALKELELFKAQAGISRIFLINSQSGEIIGSGTGAEEGSFNRDERTGIRFGLDDNGFFIQDGWELNRELFRATRFQQQIIASEELNRSDEFEFIDLDSQKRFVSPTPLRVFVRDENGDLRQSYPGEAYIEKRLVNVDFYRYILDPLTTIFQVSLETGNPVRWG